MTTAIEKLDSLGIESICDRIEDGETYRQIAADLGMNASALCRWLNNDANSQHSARAREISAEAWLDRGLDTISTALHRESGIDASAARAYAQECARRAAIRNPRYRDKVDLDVDGKIDHTISLIEMVIIDPVSNK